MKPLAASRSESTGLINGIGTFQKRPQGEPSPSHGVTQQHDITAQGPGSGLSPDTESTLTLHFQASRIVRNHQWLFSSYQVRVFCYSKPNRLGPAATLEPPPCLPLLPTMLVSQAITWFIVYIIHGFSQSLPA